MLIRTPPLSIIYPYTGTLSPRAQIQLSYKKTPQTRVTIHDVTHPSYPVVKTQRLRRSVRKVKSLFWLLVPGHKYPKTGIKEIYGKTSVRVCAPIGMIPLHFRVLMAWDKYDGSVPFGDRFHCKKSVLSVLKRKEKNLLYAGTERNRCNQTGSKGYFMHSWGKLRAVEFHC